MKLVIIDRRFWLRGEGCRVSFLRRSRDSKMCCLGFLAKACGATDVQISNVDGPAETKGIEWPEGLLTKAVSGEPMYTPIAVELMRENDYFENSDGAFSEPKRESVRESRIRDLFRDLDIEVKFIN